MIDWPVAAARTVVNGSLYVIPESVGDTSKVTVSATPSVPGVTPSEELNVATPPPSGYVPTPVVMSQGAVL